MSKLVFDNSVKENKSKRDAAFQTYLSQYKKLLIDNSFIKDKQHNIRIYPNSFFEYANLDSLEYAVRLINGGFPDGIPSYVWVNSNHLIIVPNSEEIFSSLYVDMEDSLTPQKTMIQLNINQIEYFKRDGDIHYEQVITGGGGGGTSMSGAIVGGMIAGDVGAAIGSRKPTEPIKSKEVEKDYRCTLLKTSTGFLKFDYNSYDVFLDIIPLMDYDVIKNRKIQAAIASSTSNSNDDTKNRILKLNSLKSSGLITEKEYEAKKAEIISTI